MQREVASLPFTSHVSIHQETSRCVSPDIVLSSLHEILRSSLRTPSPLHFRHQTSAIKKEPEGTGGFRDRGLIVSPFSVQQEQEGGPDANKLPSIAEWIAKNETSNNCQETSSNSSPAGPVQPKITKEIRENTNNDTSIKRPQFMRPEFRPNASFLDNSTQQLLNATLSNPPTPSPVNAKSNTAARAEEMRKSIVPSHNSAFSSIGREPGNIFGTAFIPQVAAPSTPSQQQPRSLISPQRGPLAPEITQQRTTTTTTTLAFGVVQPRSRPAPSAPFASQVPVPNTSTSAFGSTLSESKHFFHPNTSASASTASMHSPTMEGTMDSSSSSLTAAALSLTSFSAQDKYFHPSQINSRGIKRKRTTSEQLDVLENAFAEDPLPSKRTKERLAEETGLSLKRIQIWFQNRRAKQKKSGETPAKKQHTEGSN